MIKNPLALDADEILSIPLDKPEKIFNQDDLKQMWRRLAKRWHPDTTPFDKDTSGVFAHLKGLFETAEVKAESGTWKGNAEVRFTSAGKDYRFAYRTMHEIEVGKMYVGKHKLMFVLTEDNRDLFDNGIARINAIKYPAKLKAEFSKYFPKIVFSGESNIGMVAVFDKPEGSALLQDVIDYMPDGRIDPKHVAWITNAMYNITTFLDHVGICHNGITPHSVFIDPVKHGAFLLGGWWYATPTGGTIKAVPRALLRTLPREVFDTKIAQTRYDRHAVKGVGMACLGDPSMVGSSLLMRKDIPKSMTSYLRAPSGDNAVEEFSGWENALEKAFGKRKFIKWDINVDDMY